MNFVIGARGRLGRSIVSFFSPGQVVALDRSVYAEWWRNGSADDVSLFFEEYAGSDATVYVSTGILDPGCPSEEHHKINFLLPKHIIEGVSRVGLRTVTFGTVMEKLIGENTANPYILSKTRLGNFVGEYSAVSNLPLHIRIHTLYGGGLPMPFMFLGQIFNAILTQTDFNMSPGNQLREYHHIDDEISALLRLVMAKAHGVIDLSHGSPVALKDMATYIFEKVNCLQLLKIGSLAEPQQENYGILFERNPILGDMMFRETLPAVVDYLQSCKIMQRKVKDD